MFLTGEVPLKRAVNRHGSANCVACDGGAVCIFRHRSSLSSSAMGQRRVEWMLKVV